jgi:hypothetical protein
VKPASKVVNAALADAIDPGRRVYSIYLPLYNGVEKFEVGVPEVAAFKPIAPRTQKPAVFYGTSITHGACASRPGMVHTAILGRRLNVPVVNLGFSGNGTMDLAVGELMAEVDAAFYVIDCLPNMDGKLTAKNAEPFLRALRKARPETPIICVEDRTYGDAWIKVSKRKRHEQSRAALRAAYEKLVAENPKGWHYIEGAALLGSDDEATVDSSHPTDLGFVRQADAMEPVLRKALAMG